MKRYTPIFIWALLVAVAISGLVTLTSRGPAMIFTSYTQSTQFQNHMDDIYNELGRTVLNPIDLETAEKKLSVTPSEIESYRTYYGSLAEQIDTIQIQYEDRIREAESKPTVKQALVDERDSKIEDIRKNFEDDTYVEKEDFEWKEASIGTTGTRL